jgi:hypothetical protein
MARPTAPSRLTPASATITADGSSTQLLTATAKDANGNTLTGGGATVTITQLSGTGTIGPVTDNGDGTYTATVSSPTAVDSGVTEAPLIGNQASWNVLCAEFAGPAGRRRIAGSPWACHRRAGSPAIAHARPTLVLSWETDQRMGPGQTP